MKPFFVGLKSIIDELQPFLDLHMEGMSVQPATEPQIEEYHDETRLLTRMESWLGRLQISLMISCLPCRHT